MLARFRTWIIFYSPFFWQKMKEWTSFSSFHILPVLILILFPRNQPFVRFVPLSRRLVYEKTFSNKFSSLRHSLCLTESSPSRLLGQKFNILLPFRGWSEERGAQSRTGRGRSSWGHRDNSAAILRRRWRPHPIWCPHNCLPLLQQVLQTYHHLKFRFKINFNTLLMFIVCSNTQLGRRPPIMSILRPLSMGKHHIRHIQRPHPLLGEWNIS